MFCPSCERLMANDAKYCSRCGMFLNRTSERVVHFMQDMGWLWRRSWAGFASGFLGWIIVFIISRLVNDGFGMTANNLFSGMICGVFLGTAGGIIEDSGYKAVLGGLLGTVGGAVGGVLNIPVGRVLEGYGGLLPLSVMMTWALGGACIGATSGLIERSAKKVWAGVLFGAVGGAVGGFLGSAFYGSAVLEFAPHSWWASRLAEGLSGGLLGAVLWFFIGLIEKFYIFRRRETAGVNVKQCDACGRENPLQSWYCSACGRVLQTAAPRQKIVVTPYRGIERISNAMRFLSWLFGVTGFVTAPVIFMIFSMQNIYLACVSAVFAVLLTYLMVVGLSFIGDLLGCLSTSARGR